METTIPKFPFTGDFTRELRARVDEYFETNHLPKTGDWRLYSKTIILYILLCGLYLLLVCTHAPPLVVWLPACIFLGYVKAGIGFCVMHDAIHGGYSRHPSINFLMGLSLNFLGGNNTLWYTKHCIIHHTNTNINGYDEDIEAQPLLRLHPSQPWRPIHQYQHRWWYWRSVYSLLYFVWVWVNDYKKYFRKKILNKKLRFSRSEHVVFWVSKLVYVTVFVVIPIMMVGGWSWLVGYIIVMVTTSLLIATVFQLAHVVVGVDHPVKGETEEEILVHQVRTTADFATKNKFLTCYLGGLNFQVEHHLFPKISHVHYPDLHPIIKEVCAKYKIRFLTYPTFSSAVKSHVTELMLLGKK